MKLRCKTLELRCKAWELIIRLIQSDKRDKRPLKNVFFLFGHDVYLLYLILYHKTGHEINKPAELKSNLRYQTLNYYIFKLQLRKLLIKHLNSFYNRKTLRPD